MQVRRSMVVLGLLVVAGVFAAAQDSEDSARILFIAEDDQGKVWANLNLTLQKNNEPYMPMVIGVQNKASKSVILTRDSFWLADLDGIIYTMPTVKEWRKQYKRIVIDRRMMTTGGIPWEVWWRSRRLAQSNYFPDLRATRGNTTQDNITLRNGFGMVDIMYFERLRNLETGRPFFLVVHPQGWEVPIRMRLYLS